MKTAEEKERLFKIFRSNAQRSVIGVAIEEDDFDDLADAIIEEYANKQMKELLEWLEEYRLNTMSLMGIGDYEQGQIDVLTDVINRVDPNRCSYCGQKDGNHKISCPTTKSVVYLEEHRKRKQALIDMMQADEKGGLYNKDIPMEIKPLSNDVYQVVQDGTVWFQGDLLNCHVYKNKHEDE